MLSRIAVNACDEPARRRKPCEGRAPRLDASATTRGVPRPLMAENSRGGKHFFPFVSQGALWFKNSYERENRTCGGFFESGLPGNGFASRDKPAF